jgi:hypothetical protein
VQDVGRAVSHVQPIDIQHRSVTGRHLVVLPASDS